MSLSQEQQGWDRVDILATVRKRGSTLAAIARNEGLARQTLYWAMSVTPRVRANRAIADFLGVSLHELWPHWFDREGKLVSTEALPRPARNRITRGSYPTRPSRKAV